MVVVVVVVVVGVHLHSTVSGRTSRMKKDGDLFHTIRAASASPRAKILEQRLTFPPSPAGGEPFVLRLPLLSKQQLQHPTSTKIGHRFSDLTLLHERNESSSISSIGLGKQHLEFAKTGCVSSKTFVSQLSEAKSGVDILCSKQSSHR